MKNTTPLWTNEYSLHGILDLPEIKPGDSLAELLQQKMDEQGGFAEHDILVIASKVVSKSENRFRSTKEISPSQEAILLAEQTGKVPEICQLIINESMHYTVNKGRYLVAYTHHGLELSSAGVDKISDELVLLLPEDPDASARKIAKALEQMCGKKVAVIISDSFGRPDRHGAGAVAIGCYGISPLRLSESHSKDGKLKKSDETLCDFLACAAAVIMGQRGRNIPAVRIKGIPYDFDEIASIRSILHYAPEAS